MELQGTFSIDLLFSTLMILIVIGWASSLATDRIGLVDTSQEVIEARGLAENIARTVNQVYSGGNGHGIKIYTPTQICNRDYQIIINSSSVLVKIGNRRGLAYIVPRKISGSYILKNSQIVLYPGRCYNIVNIADGTGQYWIVIKQVI